MICNLFVRLLCAITAIVTYMQRELSLNERHQRCCRRLYLGTHAKSSPVHGRPYSAYNHAAPITPMSATPMQLTVTRSPRSRSFDSSGINRFDHRCEILIEPSIHSQINAPGRFYMCFIHDYDISLPPIRFRPARFILL